MEALPRKVGGTPKRAQALFTDSSRPVGKGDWQALRQLAYPSGGQLPEGRRPICMKMAPKSPPGPLPSSTLPASWSHGRSSYPGLPLIVGFWPLGQGCLSACLVLPFGGPQSLAQCLTHSGGLTAHCACIKRGTNKVALCLLS